MDMKTITLKLTVLLAAVLMFTACEKENKESVMKGRDIVYIVDENVTTVHPHHHPRRHHQETDNTLMEEFVNSGLGDC